MLLQGNNQLVAVDNSIQFGAVFLCSLEYFIDTCAIFAFQARDQVQAFLDIRQSLRIIRQATEGLPEGPIVGKVPRLIKPAAGETYHAIESPKGELGYFIVSDGKSTNPYRFRVRPPSFCNLQGLRPLIRGHLIADVVALIGSLDVVLGEVDR